MERHARFILHVFIGFMIAASIILFCLISKEDAEAKTRVYATCDVAVEDPVWIYDTYRINVDNFEKHHIGEYAEGKRFKVYETRKGMARVKFNGKNAWIGTKTIEVVKKGYIKIEGRWKKVRPGFDLMAYIRYGEE